MPFDVGAFPPLRFRCLFCLDIFLVFKLDYLQLLLIYYRIEHQPRCLSQIALEYTIPYLLDYEVDELIRSR